MSYTNSFQEQIAFAVNYMADVTVNANCFKLDNIVISDDTGFQDDIVLYSTQDITEFHAAADAFAEQYQDVCKDDIYLLLAMPYVDNCWN